MGIQFSINYNENLNKAHKLEGAWVWTFNDNSSYISRNLKLDYWRLSHSKWEFHNKALASNWNFPSFAKLWYSWFVNSLLIDYSKNYQRKSYPFHYELFVPLHWFFFFLLEDWPWKGHPLKPEESKLLHSTAESFERNMKKLHWTWGDRLRSSQTGQWLVCKIFPSPRRQWHLV